MPVTKIDIISGFLGAGKTTLIKKLLEEALADEKIVLVENEFGEVGIDSGFLKDYGIQIKELNSGCICCTLTGDFTKSLCEAAEIFHPDRILIEPSGVAKLSDIMKAVNLAAESADLALNTLITVADACDAADEIEAFGEFFANQIENAAVIVLSRTQNAAPDELEETVRVLHEHNPEAALITTPWDQLDASLILNAALSKKALADDLMKQCTAKKHEHEEDGHSGLCGHEHAHGSNGHEGAHTGHDADEIFESWGAQTPRLYTEDEIEKILERFISTKECGSILRAKGMVPAKDGAWIYFDMTPGGYELRKGSPDFTGRICVIGTDLDRKKIETLFDCTV